MELQLLPEFAQLRALEAALSLLFTRAAAVLLLALTLGAGLSLWEWRLKSRRRTCRS